MKEIVFAIDDNQAHRDEYGMNGQIPEYSNPNNTIVWIGEFIDVDCWDDITPEQAYDVLRRHGIRSDEFLECGLLVCAPVDYIRQVFAQAGFREASVEQDVSEFYKTFVLEQY